VTRDVVPTSPFAQFGVVDDKVGSKPWQQRLNLPGSHFEPFRYATDGSICVRVPINTGDLIDREQRSLPPAYSLDWTHDWPRRGRWLPWPKAAYLDGSDTDCPVCYGTGCREGCGKDCEQCDGTGHLWYGNGWDLSVPRDCPACAGKGVIITDECPACEGKPIARRPAFQTIGTLFVDCEKDRKMRSVLGDIEYFLPEGGLPDGKAIKFRAGPARGLLMPILTERAIRRIEA
jgi:hypothetical protein